MTLMQATNVSRVFSAGQAGLFGPKRLVRAVSNISLSISEGETVGLVGESGSGKSTLGRLLIGALRPSSGEIIFSGEDVTNPTKSRWRSLRRELQIIFQNPAASLDPRLRVEDQLVEVLTIQNVCPWNERSTAAAQMLRRVGLDQRLMRRFPHELSGGQLQRVVIARALLTRPRLIVCDEPVSALDVSVQANVLNLLKSVQEDFRISYLFVSHDLSVVRYLSHRIAVMYLGRIVELGAAHDVMDNPLHPYTQALVSAVPVPDPTTVQSRPRLLGEPPDPAEPPAGCRFHTRCTFATDICRTIEPTLQNRPRLKSDSMVACHRAEEITSQ